MGDDAAGRDVAVFMAYLERSPGLAGQVRLSRLQVIGGFPVVASQQAGLVRF
jgi:hypothetical protein